MTAKRTPKKRPPRRPITPAAIAIFRRIQAAVNLTGSTRASCFRCGPKRSTEIFFGVLPKLISL
jgi:hypothetical protein